MVRRVNGLYPRIAEYENLVEAFHAAARGKRDRFAVRAFEADLHPNLRHIREELVRCDVRWHGYRFFQILDPKPRRIAAPAFRDRVLHNAIMRVAEPELERIAIHDSYACRRGKGTHRAIARAAEFARRHPWFVQLDVRKYFDSIDHAALQGLLERRFKDRQLLRLFEGLIASYEVAPGRGLPIGSLTSQHLSNFYLAPLDHFVKETLRAPGYVRYMDDFVLLGASRTSVLAWRDQIEEFLGRQLRLELRDAGSLDRVEAGIPFLGMLVKRSHTRLAGKAKRRTRAKLKALCEGFAAGFIDADELAARTNALLAKTRHCPARGLRASWTAALAPSEA